MYFPNPYYKPPLLLPQQKQKLILSIQSILLIPPYNRKNEDHQELFKYFINHPYLREIQRSKSLRARILCVGQIEMITQEEYKINKDRDSKNVPYYNKQQQYQDQRPASKYIILQKFSQNNSLIVLDQLKKQKILKQDQQPIRQAMQYLKQFSLIKKMQYHQQLYLSHFLQKASSRYKEFLIQQNQQTDYVYLIEEGEFLLYKNIEFTKQKSIQKLMPTKIRSSNSPLKNYLQLEDSPYKSKQIKIVKQELAKIEGKSGQCLGEFQLFLQSQKRLFSVKCNSTTSKLFKIHFKHFKEIYMQSQFRWNQLKQQYSKKVCLQLNKISQNKYSKNGVLNIDTPLNPKSIISPQQTHKKLSQIVNSMDKYHKTMESQSLDSFFPLKFAPSIRKTLLKQQLQQKNKSRIYKLYSQNGRKDGRYNNQLTPQLKTTISNYESQSATLDQPSVKTPFFPIIKKSSLKKDGSMDSKELGSSIKRHPQKNGLVAIDSIIKQKYQLFKIKAPDLNPEFSFYKTKDNHKYLRKKHLDKSDKTNEAISPAHSPHFMKNLLKQSLKKSGYCSENAIYQNLSESVIQESLNENDQNISKPSSSFQLSHELTPSKTCEIRNEAEYFEYLKFKRNLLNRKERASLVKNQFDNFFKKSN